MAFEIYVALLCIIISFVTTFFLVFYWIKAARKFGLMGRDVNKIDGGEVPEAGGIAVVLGFIFSVLMFVFFKTFLLGSSSHLIEIFALLASVLLAGFLGFVDDILGWKRGIRQWYKPILTIPIALPLMVINAGTSTVFLPLIGVVNLGLFYPLIFILFGIVGASNGFNMLAGFNGLETLMGISIMSFLGFIAWKTGSLWLVVIIFCLIASLLAFLVFNKYPAKIFPGNSFTYSVGALVAIVAILGNIERVAVIIFIPYFIELLLKIRGRFKVESYGIPEKGGTFKVPEKCYSVTHLAIKYVPKITGRKIGERGVVVSVVLFEILFILLAFLSLI